MTKAVKIIIAFSIIVVFALSLFFLAFYGYKPKVTLDYGYLHNGWYSRPQGIIIDAEPKIEHVKVVRGSSFVPKNPIRDGYIFIDWYKDKEFTQPLYSIRVYKDTTFYAKWEKS